MQKDINVAMGARIKEKRREMRYTRETMAELADISPQFLANIESGKKGMSFETLIKICRILGVSCDYLIMGRDEAADRTRLLELTQSVDAEFIPAVEQLLGCVLRIIELARDKNRYI